MVEGFGLVMVSKYLLVIFQKSSLEILCCVCSFLKVSLYYFFLSWFQCVSKPLKRWEGPCVSWGSVPPGEWEWGISTGGGAGDLDELTLPYPTSSSFAVCVSDCRPVLLVIPRVCSLPAPDLISWEKRCWAHQMNRHLLPVLLPAMNFLFPLVCNILLERFGAVYPHGVLWQNVTCS